MEKLHSKLLHRWVKVHNEMTWLSLYFPMRYFLSDEFICIEVSCVDHYGGLQCYLNDAPCFEDRCGTVYCCWCLDSLN